MFGIKITKSNIAAPTILCDQSMKEIRDPRLANAVWIEQDTPGQNPRVIGAPKFVLKAYDMKQATNELLGVNKALGQRSRWMPLDHYLANLSSNLKFDFEEAQAQADRLARV